MSICRLTFSIIFFYETSFLPWHYNIASKMQKLNALICRFRVGINQAKVSYCDYKPIKTVFIMFPSNTLNMEVIPFWMISCDHDFFLFKNINYMLHLYVLNLILCSSE